MHGHGILRDIFFGSRKLREKFCQTLGNKPLLAMKSLFNEKKAMIGTYGPC